MVLQTGDESVARYSPVAMYAAIDVVGNAPLQVEMHFTLLGKSRVGTMHRIKASQRTMAIDSIVAKVLRNYVFLDVARRVADSLQARDRRGAYADFSSDVGFAMRLNSDLRELGADRQMGVEYAWRVPLPPSPPARPGTLHCGVDPVEYLEGDVGYVRLYSFGQGDVLCGNEISKALQAVAATPALILDLRESTEDDRSQMAYVASYLVEGCTHLGDIWDRATAQTEMLWTRDGLAGPVFGGTKPLYILTSRHTFAAAEELAYDLQSLGRATIVGETTAGAAHVGALGQVGEHLLVRVPIARVVNPITKTNWERVGVEPDVRVMAVDALSTAQQLIHEGRVVHTRPVTARAGDYGNGAAPTLTSTQGVSSSTPASGIRFLIDTMQFGARGGPLSRFAGVVEFANGRGRLDVTAVSRAPAVAVNGIIIDQPLARAGDYYLFDNLGFIAVHPRSHTFASFAFTRAEFNYTGQLLPGAYRMGRSTASYFDTLATDEEAIRQVQQVPITIHWHMQPRNGPPADVTQNSGWNMYGRGWLQMDAAPAAEAGVVRWFEVAATLATRPGGASGLASDGLEVTSVALLGDANGKSPPHSILEMLAPRRLSTVVIDPSRLQIPTGYTETLSARSARAPTRAARWRAREDANSQRDRSACRQAWLPEAPTGASADTGLSRRLP